MILFLTRFFDVVLVSLTRGDEVIWFEREAFRRDSWQMRELVEVVHDAAAELSSTSVNVCTVS